MTVPALCAPELEQAHDVLSGVEGRRAPEAPPGVDVLTVDAIGSGPDVPGSSVIVSCLSP
jgi:hypothetical protein